MTRPAIDVVRARWAGVSALLALSLACQGAPHIGDKPEQQRRPMEATQPSAPAPVPKTCSPSDPSAAGTFERLIAGERFALIQVPAGLSVLNLDQASLVQLDGVIEATACGDDCVAYRPHVQGLQLGLATRASELRLRNLRTGHEETFEGELVEEAQLPVGLVALRKGTSLGLLDARAHAWLARVNTRWPATSVAASADGRSLYVLSVDPARDRLDEHAYDAWLEVFRVPHDGSAARSHRHRYTSAELADATKFDGALAKTTEPRVYRLDSGSMVVGHLTGCARCASLTPQAHLFRVVHAQTGAPTGEAGFRYQADVSADGLEAQLWPTPHSGAAAVPERVQRALDTLQCDRSMRSAQ